MALNRITVGLDDRQYEVVQRLASVRRVSMAAVVVEAVGLVLPQLQRVVRILEAAERAPDEARAEVRASLQAAESTIFPALLESLRQTEMQLDEAGLDWSDLAGAVEPRRAALRPGGARKRPLTPVPVTRGVGYPGKGKKAGKPGGQSA